MERFEIGSPRKRYTVWASDREWEAVRWRARQEGLRPLSGWMVDCALRADPWKANFIWLFTDEEQSEYGVYASNKSARELKRFLEKQPGINFSLKSLLENFLESLEKRDKWNEVLDNLRWQLGADRAEIVVGWYREQLRGKAYWRRRFHGQKEEEE